MKKIALLLLGADLSLAGSKCTIKPDGVNVEYRPVFVFNSQIQSSEIVNGSSKIFLTDIFYGLKKPMLYNIGSGSSAAIANSPAVVPFIKKDSVDISGNIILNQFNTLIAVSTGSDFDTGQTLVYVKGQSLNNSRHYIVYTVDATLNEFIALFN